jgi:hypothetical protein
MSEWQPIETAPKDGTRIVVWGPLAVMRDGQRLATDPCAHVMLFKRIRDSAAGDWWSPSLPTMPDFWQLAHFPTHWMPLPAPPTPNLGIASEGEDGKS